MAEAAGPELDAEIAQRVFGWTRERSVLGMRGTWSVPAGDPFYGESGRAKAPPPYSTDLSAAWCVAERLRAGARTGFAFAIRAALPSEPAGWRAGYISEDDPGSLLVAALGDTPELAICRAALAVAPPPTR